MSLKTWFKGMVISFNEPGTFPNSAIFLIYRDFSPYMTSFDFFQKIMHEWKLTCKMGFPERLHSTLRLRIFLQPQNAVKMHSAELYALFWVAFLI
jgi:hypothetical protein